MLDVDDRLLAFICRELESAPFPARCVQRDLREPLPSSLASRFDTVVTDPPYTVAGASLFVARAAEALRGEGSNLFLSFGSRRPGAQFELQRFVTGMGLEVRALTRDFNDYVGAGALGGTSHLYHLAATAELRTTATEQHEGPLYTGAQRAPSVDDGSRGTEGGATRRNPAAAGRRMDLTDECSARSGRGFRTR